MDSFLVEDTETFNEVLEGTFLLGFGDGLDVAQEFVEVAGLGVHFFLLWVTQNTGDILVGWLETKTTDEVTNLISFFISPSQSYGVTGFWSSMIWVEKSN